MQKVWPGDNPFLHDRHQIMKAVKHELGPAGRDLNFNAYADNRSLFRYDMHTLPSEITQESSIGTSTLFAAWNAAIYVAQVEDHRVAEAAADGRYLEATGEVLQKHGALWFFDEVLRDLAPPRVIKAVLLRHRVAARGRSGRLALLPALCNDRRPGRNNRNVTRTDRPHQPCGAWRRCMRSLPPTRHGPRRWASPPCSPVR